MNILLGYGVFSIGSTPIGLTRGGGSFVVETEYREVEADGDKGPVKGRIAVDRQVAKLTANILDAFDLNDIKSFYPALVESNGVVTGSLEIADGDYKTVKWEGKTLEGDEVTIELENAVNLENIDWTLEDKNEVVPEITWTSTYLENARETPPWSVEFADKSA